MSKAICSLKRGQCELPSGVRYALPDFASSEVSCAISDDPADGGHCNHTAEQRKLYQVTELACTPEVPESQK